MPDQEKPPTLGFRGKSSARTRRPSLRAPDRKIGSSRGISVRVAKKWESGVKIMFINRALVALSLLFLTGLSSVSAQDGQGNAILTMAGGCNPGASLDFQIRGCAAEGQRAYLVSDPEVGPFIHPRGAFCVAMSDQSVVRRGRVLPDGTAFFWLAGPTDSALIGRHVHFQGVVRDPSAPNGIAITNCVCYPICEPGETVTCENGVALVEGIMVIGPYSDLPGEGSFRLMSEGNILAEVPMSFDLPGPSGRFSTPDGMMEVIRITTLDPCRTNGETRLGVQFRVNATMLAGGKLPVSTTFEVEFEGDVTSKTVDTSCNESFGVGLNTRPLVITCVEEVQIVGSNDLKTFTQGGWGTTCHGNNPGCFRDANFPLAFPDGLVVGDKDGVDGDDRYALTFTSSAAIEAFLPNGSTGTSLSEDAVDSTNGGGVLAGQLVAATLNVGFNDAGVLGDQGVLGDLVYVANVNPGLMGLTVRDVLCLASDGLAGDSLPGGLGLSHLVEALTRLNEGFNDGAFDGETFGF